jgi:hypothetical protein
MQKWDNKNAEFVARRFALDVYGLVGYFDRGANWCPVVEPGG